MKHSSPDLSESNLPERLSAPALRALASAGISRVEQLTTFTESDIKKLHGIGPNAMKQLREALDHKGLAFAEK